MARGKKEEKLINVKALDNLKYDKEVKKIGEELKVRVEDTEEMVEKGYVELLEEPQERLGEDNEGNENEENKGDENEGE